VAYRPFPKKQSIAVSGEKMVQGLLKAMGFDPNAYAVFEVWDRLLGKEAEKAKAVGIKGKDLCVSVDSGARLQDLMLRKRGLLKKLNEHFGARPIISDIIFNLSGGDESAFSRRKKSIRKPDDFKKTK
jgi:predicted nucleic acid-binding Zn ribbon protein